MKIYGLFLPIAIWLGSVDVSAQNKIVMKDGTGTHGGNSIGIEFAASAQDALADIVRLGEHRFPELKVEDLKRLIASDQVQILATDEALFVAVNNIQQPVAALSNVNTKTILVNEALWKGLQPGLSRKSLALHEYLVLANIEKTGTYQITSRYSSLMSGRPYDLIPICKIWSNETVYEIWLGRQRIRYIAAHEYGSFFDRSLSKMRKAAFDETMCALFKLQRQKQCHGSYWAQETGAGKTFQELKLLRKAFLEFEDLGVPDKNLVKPSSCE